jgi:hypothetical protein
MTLSLFLSCAVPTDTEPRVPDSGVRYDVDGDGYFQGEECNDNDPEIHPYAVEVCDGADNDCDGHYDEDAANATTIYADGDGDGYARDDAKGQRVCEAKKGFTTELGDCDDANGDVHPKAKEVCGDGMDNDCVGGDAAC